MALDNYRDLSVTHGSTGAGFQFEFYCQTCPRTWKSPFKPFRVGQFTAMVTMFTSFFTRTGHIASRAGDALSSSRERGARESALAEAMQMAETRFVVCEGCHKAVCDDCFDTRSGRCSECVSRVAATPIPGGRGGASGTAMSCPNCSTPSNGGRFCAECGFDMASTHKTCPSCSALQLRQARFCTDCGHSF